jgi:hypothetical protein
MERVEGFRPGREIVGGVVRQGETPSSAATAYVDPIVSAPNSRARASSSGSAGAGSIVIDETFKPADGLGVFGTAENPFATMAAEQAAKAAATKEAVANQFEENRNNAFTERHNDDVGQRAAVLEAENPGRYQTIDEDQLPDWQARWEEANRSSGVLGDTGRILKSGVIGIGQSLSSIADTVFSRLPGGETFLKASDDIDRWVLGNTLDKKMENADTAARASVTPAQADADAKNWWDEDRGWFGPAWRDPRSYLRAVGESAPGTVVTMLPGGILARGAYVRAIAGGATQRAAAATAARTATLSGAILEGGMAAGDSAKNVRDRIAALPRDQLMQSDAVRSMIEGGMSEGDAIKAVSEDAASQAFLISGVATGMFGGLGDRALAKIIAEGVGGGVARRIVAGGVRGAVAEGILEEAPQGAAQAISENAAVQRVDPNQSLTEGVGEAVASGIAAGGAMGGAMGGAGGAARPASPESIPGVDPGTAAPAPQPAGPISRAVQRADEAIAVRTPQVAPAAPAPTDGRPEVGATVRIDADGIEPFMGRIDGYEGDEAVVIDSGSGEIYQIPIGNLTQIAKSAETIERENPRDVGPVPIDDSLPEFSNDPALEPLAPIGTEVTSEGLPPRDQQKPATERFPTAPEAGQRVIVDDKNGGRFAATISTWTDGGQEAVVKDEAGREYQVPADSLFISNQTEKQVEADELKRTPPVEREAAEMTPTRRRVGDKTVELPDEKHARLFDLARERFVSKKTLGASQLDMESVDNPELKRLAREFGVTTTALGAMADDYRYRVERAGKEARSKLPVKMPPVNERRLRQWQNELAKQQPEATDRADDLSHWWDVELTAQGRKQVLDQAGVKRSERVMWQHLTPAIRNKLAATRPARDTSEVGADFAVHDAATSPTNDLPEPTQAQKEAGNYKVGRMRLAGLDLSIENPAGSERKGTDSSGKPWSVKMRSHYGYIRGTVGRDKDHIDTFIRPGTPELDDSAPVFVVDQRSANGRFDEHKVMIGFDTEAAARAAYLENYTAGWKGLGDVSPTTMGDFKAWLKSGKTTEPFSKMADGSRDKTTNARFAGERPGTRSSKPRIAKRARRPQSLFDFLAAEGGLRDDGGELAHMGLKRRFVPGRGALVRSGGVPLDKAREAAAQAGYFDHLYGTADDATAKSTVRDLLDLIDQEARGGKAYSLADSDLLRASEEYEAQLAGRADYQRFVREIAATLSDLGGDFAVDEAVLARAAEYMVEEDLSPLDAFDRAVLEDEAKFEASLSDRPPEPVVDGKQSSIPFFGDELAGTQEPVRGLVEEGGDGERNGRSGDAEDSRKSSSPGGLEEPADGLDNDASPIKPSSVALETTSEEEVASGPFGPILRGFEGRWREAALELEKRQTGDAIGALNHPDVGPIDLVWGNAGTNASNGAGLAKLLAWHPEVLGDLQGFINRLHVDKDRSTTKRIQLRDESGNAGIRLDFDGTAKTWLLTAFEKGSRRTERSSRRLSDLWGDQAAPTPPRAEETIAPQSAEVESRKAPALPPAEENGFAEPYEDASATSPDQRRPDPKIRVTRNDLRELDPPARPEGVRLNDWARDSVVTAGKQKGHEYLMAVDADGTVVSYGTAGDPSYTGMNDRLFSAMSNPDRRLVMFHNHPRNGPLSAPDIGLLSMPGVHSVWAFGHNGSSARAALTPVARARITDGGSGTSARELQAALETAAMSPKDVVRAAERARRIDPEGADIAARHIPSLLAARAGIIDMKSDAAYDPAEIKGLKEAIDRAALGLAKEYSDGGKSSARVRRSTDGVGSTRAVEGVGEVRQQLGAGSGKDGLSEGGARDDQAEKRLWKEVDRDFAPAAATKENIVGRVKDALSGKFHDAQPGLLAAVPLNYFPELAGDKIPAISDYLLVKRKMDAYRGKKHDAAAALADRWRKYISLGYRRGYGVGAALVDKSRAAELADLMHEATLAGIDPSLTTDEEKAKSGYQALRKKFTALPPVGRELFQGVRDAYREQADELDELLLDNVRKAQELAAQHAERRYKEELADIAASAIDPVARRRAEENAASKYKAERTKGQWASKARMTRLRQQFESNRVAPPYFPLSRFGDYYVTARRPIRDADGKITGSDVLHFSRHETKADANRVLKEVSREINGAEIETGRMSKNGEIRKVMDPRVVGDIERLLADSGVGDDVRDALYQRWLTTFPDLSMRKRFIHRKGIAGFNKDAFRAFGSAMFHGAHQMGRLKYGLELQENVNRAEEQAKDFEDNTREMALVNELNLRDKWVRNPGGNAFVNYANSAAFIWYMGFSPAAAIVNASQTWMMGVPLLGAKFGIGKSAAALLTASREFAVGRGDLKKGGLSREEKAAMDAFYESGLIDRTQSHDLAAVSETGTTYDPIRAKVMRAASWGFHNVEVFNRSVTALAAYRLARDAGYDHLDAINVAHERTYSTHFDMTNSSRPRIMQRPEFKFTLMFRSYQVNMLYRLFRDVHQAVKGESRQARREAVTQLAGTVGMMGLMAGATGTVGYGLAMAAASLLSGIFGDDDDPMSMEDRFKAGVIRMLGPELGGIFLYGAPGHYLGIDLTARIGMPDLWFRSPDRDLEGKAEWEYYVLNSLGAGVSMIGSMFEAYKVTTDDSSVARGIEIAAPKAVRDLMKTWRFAWDGVTTRAGDEVVAPGELSTSNLISQSLGFTPAKISETYDRASALKNAEAKINDARRSAINSFAKAVEDKDPEARAAAFEEIRKFNTNPAHRPVAITSETLKRSLSTRAKNRVKREDGALIQNEALGQQLRKQLPERVY